MKLADLIDNFKQLEALLKKDEESSGLLMEISEIIAELEHFFSERQDYEKAKEFLHHIRQIQNTLIDNQAYKAIIDNIKYQDFFYNPLIIIAQIVPYSRECPISCKTTSDHKIEPEFIALSTGFVYDKESLFSWYEKSQNFIDPTTNTPLPQTDITRIVKLKQGLQHIVDIQENFDKEKTRLLEQQSRALSMPNLSRIDQIKKYFLRFTSTRFDNETRKLAYKHLCDLRQQKDELETYNFSKIDLSGLTFSSDNHLINRYGHGKLDLRGANLSNCTFLGSCTTQECLHADLTDANLENARFLNLPMRGICIKTTNFTRANLRNVDFTGVGNWGEVNITEADLTGAYLYNRECVKITGLELKYYFEDLNLIGVDTANFENAPKIDLEIDSPPSSSELFMEPDQQNSSPVIYDNSEDQENREPSHLDYTCLLLEYKFDHNRERWRILKDKILNEATLNIHNGKEVSQETRNALQLHYNDTGVSRFFCHFFYNDKTAHERELEKVERRYLEAY